MAGLPVEVPAMTVNRVCGSGAQAIVSAAQEVMLGLIDCAIAGRHGEHGPRALPDGRRALGLSSGQRPDLRQHAAGRAERRLLRPAFGLAHRGSGQIPPDHPRGAGPLGGALAEALRGGAGRRQVHGRNRAGRAVRAEQAGALQQGRAQPPRHHVREPRQAAAGLPQGRHDHRRQRAGPQQRRGGDDRLRGRLGREERPRRRWRGSSPTASRPWSPACSAWVRCRR